VLDFIWLEKILSSEVALPMVIALGVLWLVRELNRLRRQNEALYEKQSDWADLDDPKNTFLEYAKESGLDEQKFLTDYDSQEVSDKITADLTSGNVLKINSTPTFFLNGKKIQPRSYEQFKSLVDTEIQGYIVE